MGYKVHLELGIVPLETTLIEATKFGIVLKNSTGVEKDVFYTRTITKVNGVIKNIEWFDDKDTVVPAALHRSLENKLSNKNYRIWQRKV